MGKAICFLLKQGLMCKQNSPLRNIQWVSAEEAPPPPAPVLQKADTFSLTFLLLPHFWPRGGRPRLGHVDHPSQELKVRWMGPAQGFFWDNTKKAIDG